MSERELAELLGRLPVFLVLMQRDGIILWCNRYAYGYSAAQVEGRSGAENIHPDDLEGWLHALRRACDTGETVTGEVRNRILESGGYTRLGYRIGPADGAGGARCWAVSWDLGPAPASPPALALSRLEAAAVEYLKLHGPAKGLAVGLALGETDGKGRAASQKLKVILANLVDRGLLRHTQEGYAAERRPG